MKPGSIMVRSMAIKALDNRLKRLEALLVAVFTPIEVVIGGEAEPGDIVIGGDDWLAARWQGDKSKNPSATRIA